VPRILSRRRLAAVVLVGVAACSRTNVGQGGEPTAPGAEQLTQQVRVFLISPDDQGRSGRKVGCGDSAVPVEIALPHPEPGLQGALRALLGLKGQYHEPSGLYNALYTSALELVRIERQGNDARVYLKGYLELGGDCDNPRILAELQETALQFSDVAHVQFYLEGKPLPQILAGKG